MNTREIALLTKVAELETRLYGSGPTHYDRIEVAEARVAELEGEQRTLQALAAKSYGEDVGPLQAFRITLDAVSQRKHEAGIWSEAVDELREKVAELEGELACAVGYNEGLTASRDIAIRHQATLQAQLDREKESSGRSDSEWLGSKTIAEARMAELEGELSVALEEAQSSELSYGEMEQQYLNVMEENAEAAGWLRAEQSKVRELQAQLDRANGPNLTALTDGSNAGGMHTHSADPKPAKPRPMSEASRYDGPILAVTRIKWVDEDEMWTPVEGEGEFEIDMADGWLPATTAPGGSGEGE